MTNYQTIKQREKFELINMSLFKVKIKRRARRLRIHTSSTKNKSKKEISNQQITNLEDSYIIRKLKIPAVMASDDIIEAKRAQLILLRTIKNLTNKQSEK